MYKCFTIHKYSRCVSAMTRACVIGNDSIMNMIVKVKLWLCRLKFKYGIVILLSV